MSVRSTARARSRALLGLIVLLALGACSGAQLQLGEPRPLVLFSGKRLQPDAERMEEVFRWVQRADVTIEEDPSFLIRTLPVPEPRYPWETLQMEPGDTVIIALEGSATDAQTTYQIYAFLHQMREMGRLVEWFPETETLEGYELERFIVQRTSDSWLLGRASFDTAPYAPLDELVYANEFGYLDAFLLSTRAEEFPEEHARFVEENPDRVGEFTAWWEETFESDPPGPS